eukprot:snap_masked-scaffold_93-processed-gene-0.19-mRNA-1 protein AED:1.00 eAED:1.00 QI:0/-1/0/0/-1/1/1/0/369
MSNDEKKLKTLKALRSYYLDKKSLKNLVEKDGKYELNGIEISKDEPTAYKISKSKETFSLGSLIFFLQSEEDKKALGTYFKEAGDLGFKAVKFSEKKDLKVYFSSKGTEKNNANILLPKKTKEIDKKDKRKRKKTSSSISKEKKYKIKKYWESREQPLSTKNSVLCTKQEIVSSVDKILDNLIRLKTKKQNNPNKKIINSPIKKQKKKIILSEKDKPIIIVPALGSVVTIKNVKNLLSQGKLEDEGFKLGSVKELEVSFETLSFRLVSNIQSLDKEEWRKVVAVFVSGKEWQFKSWKKFKSYAEIFDKILGLYVYFDDEKLPKEVSQWNIIKFPIKKQRRHMDSIQKHRIWQAVMSFIKEKKSSYFPIV